MRDFTFWRLIAGLAIASLPLATVSGQQTGSTQSGTTQTGGSGGTTSGASGGSMPPGSSSTALGFNLPTQNFGGTATGTSGTSQAPGSTSRNSRRTTGRTATSALSSGLGGAGAGRSTTRGTSAATQQNRQSASRAQYRTQIDFASLSVPATSNAEVTASVGRALGPLVPQGATVSFDGGTVVLQGSVASDADRKLAQQMALLEPGVRSVRNELVVQNGSSGKP